MGPIETEVEHKEMKLSPAYSNRKERRHMEKRARIERRKSKTGNSSAHESSSLEQLDNGLRLEPKEYSLI